jgi:hypothetical protein
MRMQQGKGDEDYQGGQVEIPKIRPEPEKAPREEKGKGLKQLFVTLLFLTLGLLAIVFVGDYIVSNYLPQLGAGATGEIETFQQMLRDTGILIVEALGGLTALVFLAWLVARR